MMELVLPWSFLIVIKIRRYNMLETNNNIIIVDDNEQHLNYLANVFVIMVLDVELFSMMNLILFKSL